MNQIIIYEMHVLTMHLSELERKTHICHENAFPTSNLVNTWGYHGLPNTTQTITLLGVFSNLLLSQI